MHNSKFFPYLISALLITLVSCATTDQTRHVASVNTLPVNSERSELQRIEELTASGPHLKNPNAAGRLVTFNKNAPDITTSPIPTQLTGPAYKNRRLEKVAPEASPDSVSQPSRRLTGPRYKNRSAKAHQ